MTDAWQFWVDRGGTFTDIVGRAPDGSLIQRKYLSDNPERYRDAALAGIRDILGLAPDAPLPADRVSAVKMGTTVGTNALLTHSGEPTLLLVTQGFADQLIIGDQSRPDIFALRIDKPQPLYRRVIEARERLDATGQIVHPLDETGLRAALAQARQEGLAACAIAFLHAWRNPAHELRAGAIARELGFRQITLSHQASPLIKFVPRAETAVLDAYLSPPLRRYVDRVAAELPTATRLEFMRSNGGLAAAAEFQGKDSVLSGPAGGLVGMIKVGEAAGETRLIGFDMGGTSTDVSLYAGELERRDESRVAGCLVRVPMLAVHTVAAGGGSILHFDGTRLLVGPDSAGSLPGPKSYRRGGPLAVTDANLFLGRLQAEWFPAVFGLEGNQSLDRESVAQAFIQLTATVNQGLALDYSPERLAEGFLDIAVENMADAVRHITLERGVNPADFTLVSFGGAGGQAACRVAQRLGIAKVLVSPYASVLSAYGIGLAERRDLQLTAVEASLTEALLAELTRSLPAPPQSSPGVTCPPLAGAGSLAETPTPEEPAPITTLPRLVLRYAGSDSSLGVPLSDLASVRAAFHAAHRRRFGFDAPQRQIVCTALEVETVSGGGRPLPLPSRARQPGAPLAVRPVYFNGEWQPTAIHQRDDLAELQVVPGPGLILEAGSCIVVEPGWSAHLTPRGDLLLEARQAMHARPDLDRPDPTWLTLFNRRFMSIAEDMGRVLRNTARSVNIRERLDFSCALFDAAGDLIANAPHIPVHLGSMGDSVRAILARFGAVMRPGDAYLLNSPYAGGTHLPDITVVRPIFGPDGGAPRYFTAARAHHADVGGIAPGSMPAGSRHIAEEGCLSDGLAMVREGRLLEEDIRAWLAGNAHTQGARNPDQNLADLQAQLAACAMGETLLRQLEAEVGDSAVSRYMGFVQDNAEAAVVRLLRRLKDGEFRLELDEPAGAQERPIIHLSIRIHGDRAVVDFTGTSPQQPGNLNAPAAITRSAVLYCFRTLLDTDIPLNAGVLRPLEIRVEAGSLLNPAYPAAVVAGNVETSQNIVDAIFGALEVLAASQGTMNNFSFGDGHQQYYETVCGGAGAGPDFPGAHAVHTHMTNSRLTDPEVLELNFPIRVESFEQRRGSGGPGAHAGGDGIRRRLRFLAPMRANLIALRRRIAPFGLCGGQSGLSGRQWLEHPDGSREELDGIQGFEIREGDVFVLETPGGGGYGSSV